MNFLTPLRRLLPFATASLLAMGCAAETSPADDDSPGDEGEVGASEDEVRASCAAPRKYFVTFRDGGATCAPIAGRRGRWMPEPLFQDAPADVQSTTCALRWSSTGSSRPDDESLRAAVGLDSGLAPACGEGSDASLGTLKPIAHIDFLGQSGSVGCDVCGIVRGKKIFAILPPERILLKQLAVRLSNGEERAFQLTGTEGRAVSLTLPAPPRGTTYQQGRVHIF